jgi:hypothetical protein
MKAIARSLCPLATLIAIVCTAAFAHAQYQPIPMPTPGGLSGPAFGAAIDQRLNGTVPVSTMGALYAFGSISSGTEMCPAGYLACSVTLTGRGVTLGIVTPTTTTATQPVTWLITQGGGGGWIPTWDTSLYFTLANMPPGQNPIPFEWPGSTETWTFFWSPAQSKWAYQARSSWQPPTQQGNSDQIGFTNGNSSSTMMGTCPPNVWTMVTADDGGFFAPEGGGVALFGYASWNQVTLCNHNSTLEYYSAYCLKAPDSYQHASFDVPLEADSCTIITFVIGEANLTAETNFGYYNCFINPTNTMIVERSNEFSQELPGY